MTHTHSLELDFYFIGGDILDRYFGIKFNIPMVVVKRKATLLLRLRVHTHTHTHKNTQSIPWGMSELAHARVSPYHYGEKNPELIKDKKNEDHNFTSSSSCFHSTPSKTNTQTNNKSLFLLSLGRSNLLKTTKKPLSPPPPQTLF